MQGVTLGIFIFYFIMCLVIYHSVFQVYYLDLQGGLMTEMVGSFIVSAILVALTLTYWPVAAIIIVICGLAFAARMEGTAKTVCIAVFIVIAIVVSVVGANSKKQKAQQNSTETGARYESVLLNETGGREL